MRTPPGEIFPIDDSGEFAKFMMSMGHSTRFVFDVLELHLDYRYIWCLQCLDPSRVMVRKMVIQECGDDYDTYGIREPSVDDVFSWNRGFWQTFPVFDGTTHAIFSTRSLWMHGRFDISKVITLGLHTSDTLQRIVEWVSTATQLQALLLSNDVSAFFYSAPGLPPINTADHCITLRHLQHLHIHVFAGFTQFLSHLHAVDLKTLVVDFGGSTWDLATPQAAGGVYLLPYGFYVNPEQFPRLRHVVLCRRFLLPTFRLEKILALKHFNVFEW